MATLRIGAIQPSVRPDEQDPLEYVKNHVLPLLHSCSDVDIFVLPELAPIGYTQHTFDTFLDAPLVQREIDEVLSETARKLGVFIAYGRIGHCSPPSNTKKISNSAANSKSQMNTRTIQHVVLNELGLEVTTYDKMLLCNYGDCAETNYFTQGNRLCSWNCRGFQLGILICADMRNALWARQLVVNPHHTVDVILQPAAFSRDFSFRTWKSFRETRAVENSVYWVGINYAGSNFGNSSFNLPWIDEDSEPEVLGMKPGVLVGTVERSVLDHVRTSLPYYQTVMTT